MFYFTSPYLVDLSCFDKRPCINLGNIFFVQTIELKELRLLDVHGFWNVDEHPLRARGSEVVLHEDEDLMSFYAGTDVGKLARALFDKLFAESDRDNFIFAPRRKEADGRTEAPENLLEKFHRKNFCN